MHLFSFQIVQQKEDLGTVKNRKLSLSCQSEYKTDLWGIMISSLQKDSVEIVEKKALMFVLTRGHALRVLSGKRFYKAIFLW